jgi:amino acid adenylation domain-containing protein
MSHTYGTETVTKTEPLLPADRPRGPGIPAGCTAVQTARLAVPATGPGGDDLLLAGLAALLHRYTGQDRIGLDRIGDGGLAEHVRLPVTAESTLPGLAATVRASRGPAGDPAAVGIRFAAAPEPAKARARELEFAVRPDQAAGVVLSCHYNARIFDADTIARLLGHYRTLVEDGMSNPGRPVAHLSLLTPAERRRMLVDWNRTERVLPSERCLHEAFEAAAARSPDAIAVVHAERWTYRRVNAAANRLARYLRSLGVGPDVRVGVCLDRSPLLLVAVLGVLKAGGGYVPLDPGYPPLRLAAMTKGSSCPLVISLEALSGNLPAECGHLLLLDRDAAAMAALPDHDLGATAGPDNLCYIIHTSGSTGEPKPIALRHRGVMNNIADLHDRFGLGPGDAVLALSSPSWDNSVFEFLGMTTAGGTVVIPDAGRLRDPAAWADLVAVEGVTVWNSAPALLGLLVDHLEQAGAAPLPGLRLALLGGDWVPVTLPDRVRHFMPSLRFIVMGGATEASIHSTIYEVTATDPGWTSIPYGRPMANQRVYILDEALQPVPPGVPGELYLAGIGLARGYLNRPELTAERFLDWSHGEVTGERLYRTGDLARFGPDGLIELLGRADFQVKINGLRVEPGEIEAVLRSHPQVREAVVVAGHGRLVAYVVPDHPEADLRELRELAERRLPEFMVPGVIVPLDRLPLTPNGKLDRRGLPEPPAAGTGYRAPRSAKEQVLADVYAQVLSRTRVGIDDDFVAIGGDSVRAIQVMTRARTQGIAVTPRQVLQLRTVAELARATCEPLRETAADAPARLVAVAPEDMRSWRGRYPHLADVWPLTSMQAGMLFESMLRDSGADTYHLQTVYHLTGPVESSKLRAAGQALLDRHSALRAGFVSDGSGTLVQVVVDKLKMPWREVALDRLSPAERDRAWLRLLAQDRAARFDLATPPLLRMTLVRFGDHARLVLSTHHVIIDGWSEQLLAGELLALYSEGDAASLPPAGDFREFLAWLHRQDRERPRRAWSRYLAGLDEPVLLAPAGHPRTAARAVSEIVLRLPAQESQRMARACSALGVTVNTLVQGAWAMLLSALTGRRDVLFGATVSGRSAPFEGVETIVGLFINTVPVRVRWTACDTVAGLLTGLQDERASLVEHEHHSLVEIHRAMNLPALFDTVVVFQSFPAYHADAAKPADLQLTGVDSVGIGSYPLTLIVENSRLVLQYDEQAFARSVAEAILAAFWSAVGQMTTDINRPADAIGGALEQHLGGVPGRGDSRPLAETQAGRASSPGQTASTPLQKALCAIFADVLGVDRVEIDDNFFVLGGDSLKATRIAGRMRRALGLDASIRTIFEYATVAEISGRVQATAQQARPVLRKAADDGHIIALPPGAAAKGPRCPVDGTADSSPPACWVPCHRVTHNCSSRNHRSLWEI